MVRLLVGTGSVAVWQNWRENRPGHTGPDLTVAGCARDRLRGGHLHLSGRERYLDNPALLQQQVARR